MYTRILTTKVTLCCLTEQVTYYSRGLLSGVKCQETSMMPDGWLAGWKKRVKRQSTNTTPSIKPYNFGYFFYNFKEWPIEELFIKWQTNLLGVPPRAIRCQRAFTLLSPNPRLS
jgi:hypothetical protein